MANTNVDKAEIKAWREYTFRTNTDYHSGVSRDLFRAGFCAGMVAAHETPPPVEIGGDAAEMIRELQERVAKLEGQVEQLKVDVFG